MVSIQAILAIVVGSILLIIGVGIIGTITTGGSVGDCNSKDYTGNGSIETNSTSTNVDATKKTIQYKSCINVQTAIYSTLTIMGTLMIVFGVLSSLRDSGIGR